MRMTRSGLSRLLLTALSLAVLPGKIAAAPAPANTSRLTSLEVRKVEPDKTYKGVAYVKISGVAHGVVDAHEAVVGLADLQKNAAGQYESASGFEIIAPAAGQPVNEAVYVDAENRGSAISQGALGGFLQNHKTTYARIQWQTGISPGVPAKAQGVGLVILRDFGRWLAGRTASAAVTGDFKPAAYRKLMLGGISQSAWTVNTLIAEGFNVDPVTQKGVFDAAVAIDGVGEWLAINNIAAKRGVAVQTPYVDPNGLPLSRTELLSRPATDPLYVDVANYTDFYRLRAALTSTSYSSAKFRRYDWPSPHAVGTAAGAARCNAGQPIVFNTLRYAPYMRAVVLGMEKMIGVKAAADAKPLPPSTVFDLVEGPAQSSATFNGIPGVKVRVPKVDADAWPVGGVRFPEARDPTGRPVPVAVPPVVTDSISATCGNFGGWQPFSVEERKAREARQTLARGLRYATALQDLIDHGYLLEEDLAPLLDRPFLADD
jgi:hypothetical protein